MVVKDSALRRFSEMARGLISARSSNDTIFQLIKFVNEHFSAQSWSLLLYNKKTRTLRFLYASGPGASELCQKEIPVGSGIAGWVVRHKKSALIPDAYQDSRFDASFDLASGFVTRSIIATPLLVEGSVIGVLELINNLEGDRRFEGDDLFLLETLAAFAASALDRISYVKTLRRYAFRDALTGINNRRGFNSRLRREIEMTAQFQTQFSLLLIDVNAFKQVNDGFGHPAGDRVLVRVAAAMLESIRRQDFAARLGGDEFAVLLPGAGRVEAEVVAERIIRQTRVEVPGVVPFTVSIGVRVVDPLHPDEVFESADQALYEAKDLSRQRRNAGRIIVQDLRDFDGRA